MIIAKNSSKIINLFIIISFALLLLNAASLCVSAASSVKTATGYVDAKGGAVLRKSSSVLSSRITVVPNNSKITINSVVFVTKSKTSAKYKWYYVTYSGRKGYLRGDLVDGIKYSAVTGKTSRKIYYRAGAGTSMKAKGTVAKGKSLMIYLKAKAYGSSKTWYLTKLNGSFRYVASTYITVTGSIFETSGDGTSTPSSDDSQSGNSQSSSSQTSSMNESEFKAYLIKQEFPSDYASKLAKLHVKHPNWVFIAKTSEADFSSVLNKETKDGVSLIEGCHPVSWRDKGSNSFKPSTAYLYKTASTATRLEKLSNSQKITVLSETFDRNKVKWTKVKTSGGKTGFTKESISSQSYPKTIAGKVNSNDVNVRAGAGTNHTILGSLSKNDSVQIVLRAIDKDGDVWYKIKRSGGYAYIYSTFVTITGTATETVTTETEIPSDRYPVVKASVQKTYYARPDSGYPAAGKMTAGKEYTVTSQVKDSKSKLWYKIYAGGKLYYVQADGLTVSAKLASGSIPSSVKGVTLDELNYRSKPGTDGALKGTFARGKTVTITGVTSVSGNIWFKVKVGSSNYYFIAKYIQVTAETAPADAAPVIKKETVKKTVVAKPENLTGTGQISISSGSYIAKDGSNWFNASRDTVAYFIDPRNFLDETRIYMFEDLSYHSEYHTIKVTGKVITGSKLPGYGFTADIFVNAGKKYSISPIHLAARARQETGGGSDTIRGVKYNGRVVYNPFNIGAYSSGNPVSLALKYAYNAGWITQTKAVNGGASFLSSGYISKGQNSVYLQKWNVLNGASKVATHQYMTNIMAPFYEAATTKSTYASYGVSDESLTFVIPVYKNMPSSTSLPN